MTPYIPATCGGKNFYYAFSLLEYDGIPIVFLATDDKRDVFLCECTDARFGEQNWTIVHTDYPTVILLITRQITMYEAIRRGGQDAILVTYNIGNEQFSQRIVSFEMLAKENLPDVDTRIWLTNDSALEDVHKLFMKHSLSANMVPVAQSTILFQQTQPACFIRITLAKRHTPETSFYTSTSKEYHDINEKGVVEAA